MTDPAKTVAGIVRTGAREAVADIPKERLADKVRSWIIGGAIAGSGIALKLIFADVPWWVPAGFVGIGFNIGSNELLMKSLKAGAKIVIAVLNRKDTLNGDHPEQEP